MAMASAIEVKRALKSYGVGAQPILDNLDLTVKSGCIYGLLGSSGCGKTTLLSCVVGVKRLDSGTIKVFGRKPGSLGNKCVGYMPQDIALINIFTIDETLRYYGLIYGMEDYEIQRRRKFLTTFLELPDTAKKIGELSGGQLRRVSFAVALIYPFPLLIMDEPTVGLDPVLRQSIWEHLTELAEHTNTTIIITTHYIEEARFCDKIGVLRHGRLLTENSPSALLSMHNSSSLESVVLQLCHQDMSRTNGQKNMNWNNNRNIFGTRHNSPFLLDSDDWDTNVELTNLQMFKDKDKGMGRGSIISMSYHPDLDWDSGREIVEKERKRLRNFRVISALIRKLWLRQIRHPALIFILLFLPVMHSIIYENTVGLDPLGLKMVVVNENLGSYVGKNETNWDRIPPCPEKSKKNSSCIVDTSESGDQKACALMQKLNSKHFDWIATSSRDEALARVKEGRALGYLEIPVNYSEHLRDLILLRQFVDNETLNGATLKLQLDETVALTSGFTKGEILSSFQAFLEEGVASCGMDKRLVQFPLQFRSVYEKAGNSWVLFIQPSLILVSLFMFSNYPGLILVEEKRLGIMEREAVAGVRYWHIVVANFVSNSCTILIQTGIYLGMFSTFYGMKVEGSWALVLGLSYLAGLAGLCFALLLATFGKNEMEILPAVLGLTSIQLISTGGIWPIEAVTPWFRHFCSALPVTFPTEALRGVMFRGWGLGQWQVQRGFGVLIIYSLIFLGFSVLARVNRN